MENKKIIQLVESFILLPIVTISIPFGNLPNNNPDMLTAPKVVLSQKPNIEISNLFAFNQEKDPEITEEEKKAEIRKQKALAIDDYFKSKKMPLAGMGMHMVLEAEKNGLDWRLIPAISVIESTGGKHACKKVTHSFLGWGSCKINFESKEKAIEIVAWNLGGNNPKTSKYYQKGQDLVDLLQTYNPPSIVPNYADKVIKVMNTIGPEEITLDPEIKEIAKDKDNKKA